MAKTFFSAETTPGLNSCGLGLAVYVGHLGVGRGEEKDALGFFDASVLLPLLDELGLGLLAAVGQVEALVLDEGLQGLLDVAPLNGGHGVPLPGKALAANDR